MLTSRIRANRGPILLIGALVGIPLLLSILTGAWEIPHNDAWSHSKIAQTFGETGRIELVGWNRSALIGQVVILGPLASSVIVQHLSVTVWAIVALTSMYLILEPRVGRPLALWTLAAIGVTAEFALLSTSFMTDIPMLAGVMASLAMLDRATSRDSLGWFAGALAVSLWATTVRDTAIAAVIAVIAIGVIHWRGQRRAVAAALSAFALVLLVAFQVWRRSLPENSSPWLEFTPGLTAKSLMLAVLACGLMLAPVILLIAAPRRWPRRSWAAAAVVLVVGLAWTAWRGADAVFGNYLTTRGAYPTVFATTPQVLPDWVLAGFALVGAVGAALLVGEVASRRPRMDRNAAAFAILLVATTFGPSLLSQEIFARGLLPLLPFVAILIGQGAAPGRRILPAAMLAVTAVVALLITLQAMTLDTARWRFAEELVAQGWSAVSIDAGLEWNGTQAPGRFALGDPLVVCPLPGADQQGITITAQRPETPPTATWTYRTFGWGSANELYAIAGPPCR